MKTILRFFASGFFRRLGSIFAILVLCLIMGLIIHKYPMPKSIGNLVGDLLGIESVSAATLTPTSFNFDARFNNYRSCSGDGWCKLNNYGSWYGTQSGGNAAIADGGMLSMLSIKYYYSSNFVSGNTYNFKVRINTSYSRPDIILNTFKIFDIRAGNSTSDLSNQYINSYSKVNTTHDSENDKVYYVTFSVTPNTNVKYIWIYYGFENLNIKYYGPGLTDIVGNVVVRDSGIIYSESTSSAINQQTQAINNQTQIIIDTNQQLQDTLTDTDTDQDSTDASDFINDFGVNTDGVVSNIILLPINMITQLLNSESTADLCTTYKNKNICLPNGKLVWSHSHPMLNAFKQFFQLVVGGILTWKMLRGLIKTIEIALDPTQNGIEVMKL